MQSNGLKEGVVTDFIERLAGSRRYTSDDLTITNSDECKEALRKLQLNEKEEAILHETNSPKSRRQPRRPNLRVSVREEDLCPANLQGLNSPTASCKVRQLTKAMFASTRLYMLYSVFISSKSESIGCISASEFSWWKSFSQDGARDYYWTQALSRAEKGTPADPSGFIYGHRVHLCDKRPLTPLQRSVASTPGSPAITLISPIKAQGTPDSGSVHEFHLTPHSNGGSPRSPWMVSRSEKMNWQLVELKYLRRYSFDIGVSKRSRAGRAPYQANTAVSKKRKILSFTPRAQLRSYLTLSTGDMDNTTNGGMRK
eukprot:2422398-Pyramimonas_sp.AAC.2